METQVEKLLWTCELPDFITHLNLFIPRRDTLAYRIFLDRLEESHQIPLAQEKVWVLALARGLDEEIVWNLGHVASKMEMMKFESIFENAVVKDLSWSKLEYSWKEISCEKSQNYSSSAYRPGMANRHGHANVCPNRAVSKGYRKAKVWNMGHRTYPRSPAYYEYEDS